MRVLIINTSERMGGAAIAANRLMESLNGAGIDTGMLVLHKTSHSDKVHTVGKSWQRKFTFIWERLIIWANNLFSRKNLFRVIHCNHGVDVTGFRFSKRQISFTCIGFNQGHAVPCTIFNKSSPPANLLSGRCTTCGNVPPSAIIPTLANHSKTKRKLPLSPFFPGTTTCLTASSRKNRAYSLRQE